MNKLCLSIAAAILSAASLCAQPPQLKGSYRFDRGGWIYVHLEGSPDRLGFQHGYLLSAEIDDLLRVLKPFLLHETRRGWNFYRDASEKILWPKIDREFQREIDGIVAGAKAKGSNADRWDIVALNALEELPYYYLPSLEKKQGKTATTHAPGNCSAFIATGSATLDGKIVMGHNNWTNIPVGERWNIVFDLVPEHGNKILMDGLPGVIVSDDDFGVNSAGIMVTETTITGFDSFDENGSPEFYRARKALQYANSIDDYVRIMLDGNNGGYANDWLVGDNKTGEIALFELGLKEHSVRRTKDGYFVGSNFPVDPKLIQLETNFDAAKKDNSPNARHTRWEELMAKYRGKITAEIGKKMESDSYDIIEKRDGPTERSLCGAVENSSRGIPEWDWRPYFPGGTVQAKVIDGTMASKMQFWGAAGRPCGPAFVAKKFLADHPEYSWTADILRDMPTPSWTQFTAGMKP